MWATGQSGGAPGSHCSLSGAPSGAFSDSTGAVRALFTVSLLLQMTVGADSRYSAGAPDSPVLHRTIR
jgi:acid phosphatase family membrane protein YuiD